MHKRRLWVVGLMSLVNFSLVGCSNEILDAEELGNSRGKQDSQQTAVKNSLTALRQAFADAAKYRYKEPPQNLAKENDPYREIDAYEVENIINQIKLDGITPSELLQFRYSSECDEFSCRYEILESARELFRTFRYSKEMRGLLIPDPALPDPQLATRDNQELKYQPMEPSLFVEGRSPWDIVAGTTLDDSFFLASLAAIVQGGEEADRFWDIDQAIQWNDDGTFTVTLFEKEHSPVKILVDSDIAVEKGGKPAYAHSRNAKELWPGLIEKAYALKRGGYVSLAHGGKAGDALATLTGHPVETITVNSSSDLFEKIEQANNEGRPMVATTKVDKKAEAEGKPAQRSYMVDMSAIRRVPEKQGKGQFVILHPSPSPSGDPLNLPKYRNSFGEVVLPLDIFVENFSEIDIVLD